MASVNFAKITAFDHMMNEQFGGAERAGLPSPFPAGFAGNVGRVVLAVAAGDGNVSQRERDALIQIMRGYGASDAEVRQVRDFDPKKEPADAMLQHAPRTILRAVLYDAIRVARVDGFADREREMARSTARKLGLDAGIVAGIEALIRVEDAVLESRRQLIRAPGTVREGHGGPAVDAGSDARAAEYGEEAREAIPRDFLVRVGKSIMTIAAADGTLSDDEMSWFIGHCRTVGAPDDVIEEFIAFEPKGARLEDFLDDSLRPLAASLVFDALRTARADGVTDRERKLAREAGARLGLDPSLVLALEAQLDIEAAVRDARIRLLMPSQ